MVSAIYKGSMKGNKNDLINFIKNGQPGTGTSFNAKIFSFDKSCTDLKLSEEYSSLTLYYSKIIVVTKSQRALACT